MRKMKLKDCKFKYDRKELLDLLKVKNLKEHWVAADIFILKNCR